MSTLKVNNINEYTGGGGLVISGSSVTINGYTPTSATSASYAIVAENLTAGNKTLNGNITVGGTTTSDNFFASGSSDVTSFQSPATAVANYEGVGLWTSKASNSNNLWINSVSGSGRAPAASQVYLGAYDPGYAVDEALFINVTYNNGVQLDDWAGTWLSVPYAGSPTFSRKVTVNNVLKLQQQDPLPAGSVGELAVSGSNLYFHNGTSWQLK